MIRSVLQNPRLVHARQHLAWIVPDGLKRVLLLVCLLGVSGRLLFAQQSSAAVAGPSAAPLSAFDLAGAAGNAAAPSSFRVGPGDVLSLAIANMPELNRSVMVGGHGDIRLSFLSHGLHVAGLTAFQIASRVASELRSRQIILDPQVDATVIQVHSRPIVISGEVRSPQVIQAVQSINLLNALVICGGISDSSATSVLVTRPTGTHRPSVTWDLPLNKVLAGAGSRYDPRLRAGDIVQVLPGGKVYVVGDVKHPGAFPLSPGQRLHVSQVLALVGSWNMGANAGHAVIVRRGPSGKRVIPLNLPRILNHHASDPVLEANDLVYVPGDAKRELGLAVIKGVGGAMMLGLGYLIVR